MIAETSAPGWLIGSICYVDQEKIKFRASLTDFSDRMLNGEPRHINGLNQYLYAYLSTSTRVILRMASVEEAEKPYADDPSSKFSASYIFTAVPLGEIDGPSYVPGVIDLPMVGANVYACDNATLLKVFCGSSGITIGTLAGYESVRPSFDINSLFTGHLAILGNTGSGKSTTARLLLDNVAKLMDEGGIKNKPLFVVFDLHGDYEFLTGKQRSSVRHITSSDYHLAPGELTIEDWSAILDPSKRIQKPLLERAVRYARLSESGKQKLYGAFAYSAIRDTSVDSHAARKFQIAKYYQVIESKLDMSHATNDSSGGYQLKKGGQQKRARDAHELLSFFNLDYGNIPDGVTEDLESILRAFIEDKYMSGELPDIGCILSDSDLKKPEEQITIDDVVNALDFVFDEEEVRGNRQARSYSEGLVTQLNNLRERYASNLFSLQEGESISELLMSESGLVILDVSQIVDETGLKLFSNFVARSLFQRNVGISDRSDCPIYLVFDEAHRYIRDADLTDDSIFNRIAREGRKFGVYLAVISQIPSELSRVVLSQVGTFIIHRIQNSYDLDYIRRNVPAITYSQVMRLPSFSPGTAIALGSSLIIPLEMQIDDQYAYVTPSVGITSEK